MDSDQNARAANMEITVLKIGAARMVKVAAVFMALLPAPAIIAPYVSENPVFCAYRMYHPFFYRYPVQFSGVAHDTESHLPGMPPIERSLTVAGLMVQYW